jgi:hypothetical protein
MGQNKSRILLEITDTTNEYLLALPRSANRVVLSVMKKMSKSTIFCALRRLDYHFRINTDHGLEYYGSVIKGSILCVFKMSATKISLLNVIETGQIVLANRVLINSINRFTFGISRIGLALTPDRKLVWRLVTINKLQRGRQIMEIFRVHELPA